MSAEWEDGGRGWTEVALEEIFDGTELAPSLSISACVDGMEEDSERDDDRLWLNARSEVWVDLRRLGEAGRFLVGCLPLILIDWSLIREEGGLY